ncbi:hypothetical protein AB0383_16755 [Amycolatopsis sp. NPDC051373]|uniref:hypothetical protein n=1 Tax=Amycolatopsis sp. NPDC051373 TaxID=3155801 RepID=UPI00344C6688
MYTPARGVAGGPDKRTKGRHHGSNRTILAQARQLYFRVVDRWTNNALSKLDL